MAIHGERGIGRWSSDGWRDGWISLDIWQMARLETRTMTKSKQPWIHPRHLPAKIAHSRTGMFSPPPPNFHPAYAIAGEPGWTDCRGMHRFRTSSLGMNIVEKCTRCPEMKVVGCLSS